MAVKEDELDEQTVVRRSDDITAGGRGPGGGGGSAATLGMYAQRRVSGSYARR
jgi:hypothetical protein